MNCLWLVGQSGIVLEVIGAGTLVVSAYTSSKKIQTHKTDLDHIQYAVDELIKDTKNQFRTQAIGFLLLVIGLAMQFIGGFAQ